MPSGLKLANEVRRKRPVPLHSEQGFDRRNTLQRSWLKMFHASMARYDLT
jgi:hypothetical protein